MNFKIQDKIDKTYYWDSRVLDFRVKYCGDEVELLLENTIDTSYKIIFLKCYEVNYKTNADMRWNDMSIKYMKVTQFDYFAHEIKVESGENGFLNVKLELPFLYGRVVCKDIEVVLINNKDEMFFWDK